MAWLKMPITWLHEYNLFTVNDKADALACPNLTNAREGPAQTRGRREGYLIIIACGDRAPQCVRAP